VTSLAVAPDGALYSAGWGDVRRWDVGRGTSEIVVKGKHTFMDLGEDGRTLLTATRQGPNFDRFPSRDSFQDLARQTVQSLATHGTTVTAVALDSTSRIAVTGSADGIVRAGPVTDGEPHLPLGHQGAVLSVAVSPDGR
jgi:WD40 repeat protein